MEDEEEDVAEEGDEFDCGEDWWLAEVAVWQIEGMEGWQVVEGGRLTYLLSRPARARRICGG